MLAVGTEGLHYQITYRSFNPWDGIFNVLGVVVGWLVARGFVGCYYPKYEDLKIG